MLTTDRMLVDLFVQIDKVTLYTDCIPMYILFQYLPDYTS